MKNKDMDKLDVRLLTDREYGDWAKKEICRLTELLEAKDRELSKGAMARRIEMQQEFLEAKDREIEELRTVLEAWQSTFGSRQLTHASCNFESVKSERDKLQSLIDNAELPELRSTIVYGDYRAEYEEEQIKELNEYRNKCALVVAKQRQEIEKAKYNENLTKEYCNELQAKLKELTFEYNKFQTDRKYFIKQIKDYEENYIAKDKLLSGNYDCCSYRRNNCPIVQALKLAQEDKEKNGQI